MKFLLSILSLFLLLASFPVLAEDDVPPSGVSTWYLPVTLNDSNTTVRFELDSTWHLVHGATTEITGTAELSDPTNPTSVHISLRIPVAKFDTHSSSRDKKLRNVMAADQYKYVTFSGANLQHFCTPAKVLSTGSCQDVLKGNLTIRSTTKPVELPIMITADKEKAFTIKGNIPIRWAEYKVEDPSILIARIKPVATVFFTLNLHS